MNAHFRLLTAHFKDTCLVTTTKMTGSYSRIVLLISRIVMAATVLKSWFPTDVAVFAGSDITVNTKHVTKRRERSILIKSCIFGISPVRSEDLCKTFSLLRVLLPYLYWYTCNTFVNDRAGIAKFSWNNCLKWNIAFHGALYLMIQCCWWKLRWNSWICIPTDGRTDGRMDGWMDFQKARDWRKTSTILS